jgi:hypothetical protein
MHSTCDDNRARDYVLAHSTWWNSVFAVSTPPEVHITERLAKQRYLQVSCIMSSTLTAICAIAA